MLSFLTKHSIAKIVALMTMTLICDLARAELDPELAQTQTKNDTNWYLGGLFSLGQTYATTDASADLGYFLSIMGGYHAKRDSWSALETDLEIGTAWLSYKKKGTSQGKVNLKVRNFIAPRFGYAWSMGSNAFNIVRVGAGAAFMDYSEKANGVTSTSDNNNGLLGLVSYEMQFPISDYIDFLGGLRVTHFRASINDITVDGKSFAYDDVVGANLISLTLGMRATF